MRLQLRIKQVSPLLSDIIQCRLCPFNGLCSCRQQKSASIWLVKTAQRLADKSFLVQKLTTRSSAVLVIRIFAVANEARELRNLWKNGAAVKCRMRGTVTGMLSLKRPTGNPIPQRKSFQSCAPTTAESYPLYRQIAIGMKNDVL